MAQDQKLVKNYKHLSNQNGQAVVEYILLLVVIVSLVMGSKQAFKNVSKFMDKYIGDYVICLMEYGELPSLEVADGSLKNHSGGSGRSCSQTFDGFAFVGGSGGSGSSSGGGSGGGSGSGSGNSGSGSSNQASSGSKNSNGSSASSGKNGGKNSSSDKNGSDSSDGSSSRGGRGGKSGAYAGGKINRSSGFGTSDSGSELDADKVKSIADTSARKRKKDTFSSTNSAWRNASQSKYKAVTGNMAEEIEKRSSKAAAARVTSVRKLAADGGYSPGPYKKTFTPPVIKPKEIKEDDSGGFSFGYIIRWLIIGGVIMAIIVFFGGQVMNYNNSSD